MSDVVLDELRQLLLGDLYDECKSNPQGVSRTRLEDQVKLLQEQGCIGECTVDHVVSLCKLNSKTFDVKSLGKCGKPSKILDDCGLGCSESTCAICLEPFTQSNPAVRVCTKAPRKHCFHDACIKQLKLRSDKCPSCRAPLQEAEDSEQRLQELQQRLQTMRADREQRLLEQEEELRREGWGDWEQDMEQDMEQDIQEFREYGHRLLEQRQEQRRQELEEQRRQELEEQRRQELEEEQRRRELEEQQRRQELEEQQRMQEAQQRMQEAQQRMQEAQQAFDTQQRSRVEQFVEQAQQGLAGASFNRFSNTLENFTRSISNEIEQVYDLYYELMDLTYDQQFSYTTVRILRDNLGNWRTQIKENLLAQYNTLMRAVRNDQSLSTDDQTERLAIIWREKDRARGVV